MRKRINITAVLLLVLWVGAIAAGRSSILAPKAGQEQEERPKFYVRQVIFEANVKNSLEVLGKPDGRFAEIAPGGQMILLMEDRIYPSASFDSGSLVVKEESEYGLEGWFLVSGTKQEPQFAWMPLVKGRSPASFRLTVREGVEGSAGLNMIRISNAGTKPILLDALVGYGREGDRPAALVVRPPLW